MTRALLMFTLGLGWLSARSQEWQLTNTVHLPVAEAFSVDQFGSIYTVKGYEIHKFDSEGNEVYAYANPILGDIYEIDALNPLAIYLFFKDANQMTVVDNRLNQKSAFNFNDYHFIDVQLISFSDQENVWFYDQGTDKLHRFNIRSGTRSNESLTITQVVGEENTPAGLESSIDRVYLNIPRLGIFIFDATGAFTGLIPLKEIELFDVEGRQLVAVRKNEVIFYNLKTGSSELWQPGFSKIRDIKLFNNTLYLFDGTDLKVFAIGDND